MAKSKITKKEEQQEEQEVEVVILNPAKSPHACHFVCGCSSFHFFFFFTSIFLLFFSSTFSEASSRLISTTTVSTSLSPSPSSSSSSSSASTNSPTSSLKPAHVDQTLIIILTISSAAFLLISIMVVFKCFRFGSKRKQNQISTATVESLIHEDHNDDMVDESSNFSVRKFSWNDIERSTNNFSKVIGSGGYSIVYLARNPKHNGGSGFRAIKINNGSERLNQVFKQELDILLRLQHDHIVKLLGYCDEQEEGALVFEYVANGTLQDKLHGCESIAVLPWKNRMAIAYQIAQALEYLHEKCALQIVHMDIKASNVLLDENLNCKLCDFGSAKMGFSSTVHPPSSTKAHVLTMMGSPGYTDPHYLRTGIASKKNDVYSFGVLILELVTGMEAFCSEKGQFLTSIMGPKLVEGGCDMAAEMVDGRLGLAGFDLEEAKTMLSISAMCLRQSPTLRPSATQIVNDINAKIGSIAFLQSQKIQTVY